MNPKLLPETLDGKIARVNEECGEVVQVIGKIGRFGLDSRPPGRGGPNNAAFLLSELADLRHAISVLENGITDHANVKYFGDFGDTVCLIWTPETITAGELRELVGEDCDDIYSSDDDFLAGNKVVQVCAGEWHREGTDYRLYADPSWHD